MTRPRVCSLGAATLLAAVCHPAFAETACGPGGENPAVSVSTPTSGFDLVSGTAVQAGITLHAPTGLHWARCAVGQQWTGAGCSGEASLMRWSAALEAAQASTLGGFSDWRVPSRSELESIIEQRCFAPSINVAAFPQTPSLGFFSSTAHALPITPNSDGSVWVVGFGDGDVLTHESSDTHAVRLVRGGRLGR